MKDLKSKIPGAKNFSYGEFVKSITATRLDINNVPTEEQWQNIEKLAVNILQPLRDYFGPIRITSGFRSQKLNKAIKGDPKSNHCRGEATDIEPVDPKISLMDLMGYISEYLNFRELIAEYFPNGWVHVAYRSGANDKIIKLKDKNHDYAIVDLEYIANMYL